jgi:protein gp37
MTEIAWVKNLDGSKGQTWNPLMGCNKISPGCANCYAEKMAIRLKAMGVGYYQDVVSEKGWNGIIHLEESVLEKPLKRKKPTTYFVNSMSDLFHNDVPIEFIQKVFDVMNRTPQHTYQVLTKRANRLLDVCHLVNWAENIWMGVSVENQFFTSRIDYLIQTPAKVKFLSCEPLLSDLDLSLKYIDWVIVGGESGHKARPIKQEWVENILKQCQESNVPFFFKQWGGRYPKANGNELNGVKYEQMPFQKVVVLS